MKIIEITVTMLLISFLLLTGAYGLKEKIERENSVSMNSEVIAPVPESERPIYISQNTYVTINVYNYGETKPETESEPKPDMELTDEEIELVALVTVGEAEGEEEYGKRLVIDAILNRVDSLYFPNTIKEVIYQDGQFECVRNGRLKRCKVTDFVRDLVRNEAFRRINRDVIFFTAGGYGRYGKPMFKEGNHYFCSY